MSNPFYNQNWDEIFLFDDSAMYICPVNQVFTIRAIGIDPELISPNLYIFCQKLGDFLQNNTNYLQFTADLYNNVHGTLSAHTDIMNVKHGASVNFYGHSLTIDFEIVAKTLFDQLMMNMGLSMFWIGNPPP